MAGFILANVIGLIAASFMLYFPYTWCRRRNESEESYGLKWFLTGRAKIDVAVALAVTLIPLTVIVMYLPADWGGGLKTPSFWDAVNILGGGIAAAFIEETFFRGWLQTITVRKFGAVTGIIMATALFAAVHLIAVRKAIRLLTFFPGLIMALLRHRNGSVMPGIIYHAVCNVWAVWFSPLPGV
ncbi:MAG: CPBP family intramembrane metalloprotease [Synergistaceae bacterium]|nr:CPBP family intramembrane metalloprotease [Synergistaceae bacterium]MBQ7168907.1 CPBP family intramembrane metalloprotease [Synergistaceae bacterium]